MSLLSKSALIITLLISAATATAGTFPTSPLVKIGVDHTGIFEITPQQLAQMGFSSAGEVSIYGYGGVENRNFDMTLDIDGLPEIPTIVTDDGRLLFYGEGPTRYKVFKTNSNTPYIHTAIENNSCTKEGYYFLAPSTSPRRITTPEVTANGKTLKSHCSSYIYFPQTTNPAHGGSHFLGDDISAMPNHEITFNIPLTDLDPNDYWQALLYSMSSRSSQNSFTIQNLTNAPLLQTTSASASNLNDADIYFSSAVNRSSITKTNGDNYNVTFSFAKNTTTTYAALAYLTLTYNRLNNILDSTTPLSMYFYGLGEGTQINITNAGAGTLVWDVTDCRNATSLPTTLSGTTMTATATATHPGSSNIIAFDPGTTQGTVTLHETVNMGRLHDMTTPNLVIITAPVYSEYARRLAQLHRDYQGMTAEVVTQDEIFNEFGSGARSPYSIRRFMKYLYDRDPGALKHLVLFGPATYDPAGHLTGYDSDRTHVLTYESEDLDTQGHAAKCFASDAFYAYIDDRDFAGMFHIALSHMAINVGRISCISEGQAAAYVDKAERYLTTPPSVDIQSHALITCDHGEDNSHLKQALQVCELIEKTHAPHTVVTHAFSALYDRSNKGQERFLNTIISTLNKGVGYMSYSGHANAATIGSDSFLKRNNVTSLENKNLPLILLSTCYALGFDRDENTVGQQFIFNSRGGAIGVIGSGRAVSREYNQLLAREVVKQQFSNPNNIYIGDVFRSARNGLVDTYYNNTILAVNNSCYNFMGDPAMPRYIHTHAMKLDVPEEGISIRPLEHNVVSGKILNEDGDIDTSFNGRAIISLYEPAEIATTNYDLTGCAPKEFARREKLVSTTVEEIKNGSFSASVRCPESTTTGTGFRILAHAITHAGNERAVTYTDDVSFHPVSDMPQLADGTEPIIDSFYINDEGFENGNIVSQDIKVCAHITPSTSGLRFFSALGSPMHIDLDGTRYSDICSFITQDIDGTSTLNYNITGLADGLHQLTLVISDNADVTVKESLNFQVITRPHTTLTVAENTAMTEANISLTHTLTTEPVARLVIEDHRGNTVFTASDVMFPYSWDLTDNDGNPVADGRYTVHALLQAGSQRSAATPATITVVK